MFLNEPSIRSRSVTPKVNEESPRSEVYGAERFGKVQSDCISVSSWTAPNLQAAAVLQGQGGQRLLSPSQVYQVGSGSSGGTVQLSATARRRAGGEDRTLFQAPQDPLQEEPTQERCASLRDEDSRRRQLHQVCARCTAASGGVRRQDSDQGGGGKEVV